MRDYILKHQKTRVSGSSHSLRVCTVAWALSTLMQSGCRSEEVDRSQTVRPEVSRIQETQIRGVTSAGTGLFVILGPTEIVDSSQAQREYLGWDAELIIVPKAGAPPVGRYTFVSETRSCVGRASELVVLWIARRENDEQLSQAFEGVSIVDCAERIQHEWIAAVDGEHDQIRWIIPRQSHSQNSAQIRATADAESLILNYSFAEPGFGVVLTRSVDTRLNEPRRCSDTMPTPISIVRHGRVQVRITRGTQLGLIDIEGEDRHLVHVSADGLVLKAWRVDTEGLDLVTEVTVPRYTGACNYSKHVENTSIFADRFVRWS